MAVFVTMNDIADIGGVGRSAVANWRKRHADFPLPNASERFDLEEVERWLIERGKIAGRVPPRFILWRLADALRNLAKPNEVMRFVLSSLVYLQACDRTRGEGDHRLDIDPAVAWPAVRESPDDALATTLLEVATAVERRNPELAGLMTPGLALATRTDAWLLRAFLDTIEEVAKDDLGLDLSEEAVRVDLFEHAVSRVQETDRFRSEYSTPNDLTYLMVRLGAARTGTVFDPAAGEGGLLLMAALAEDRDQAQPMNLVGFELNAEVLNVSRAQFFLYGEQASLKNVDSFRVPREQLPSADLVLLDPPLGASNWGDADIYLDDRWSYGVPPPKSADLAWIQLAVQSLAPGGRAVVVTSPSATSGGGREAAIRSALLDAGCIVGVVLLPPRMRPNTSIPLALWILRAPGSTSNTVLLIDANSLGEAGRSLHSIDETDILRIVDAVHAYETDPSRPPDDSKIAWRVAVSDLVDANLDPTRYRPAGTVDLEGLRQRREELRASLAADTGEAKAAVAAVLSRLGDRQ
jgi:type I restriction-modification system DNA methylase subunit